MEDDQVAIQVRFALKGDLKAFPHGSPGVYNGCAAGIKL
jgi:hypothetical protein